MFESKSIEECQKSLQTDILKGLSSNEAKIRLERNGKKHLRGKERKKGIVMVFLTQLNNPMIYIIGSDSYFIFIKKNLLMLL